MSNARTPLRVLMVEDSEDDALVVLGELDAAGYDATWTRVDDADGFRGALRRDRFDLVLSDHLVPGFGSLQALAELHASGLDLPFIIVSGTIGEAAAVAAMRAGAHDYVLKRELALLGPVVARALRESAMRHALAEADREAKAAGDRLRQVVSAISDHVWSAHVDRTGERTYGVLSPVVELITGRPAEHFRHDP
jgi:sigma-B regulation protein RsbU (phosphoserine phosphatase)